MITSVTSKTNAFSKDFFAEKRPVKYARHTPSVNIEELEHEYVLKLAAPGFCREELAVLIKGKVIAIASLKAAPHQDSSLCIKKHCEYDFSVWRRNFVLPQDADPIMCYAFYMNGELLVHIPKGENEKTVDFLRVVIY